MAGWDDTMFGNLPRPRRPGQQRSGPFTAQDIVSGAAGPPQEARQYNDPTFSGFAQQSLERGAEALGAPMSVQRKAGDIGSFVGGLTGLDMPQHLSDAWNYLRYGAPGQAALSAAAAVPGIPGAAAARTAEEVATGAAKAAPPLVAYHGSPYAFDRFDISKLGTGEGANAYGSGLYFAENEGVAKNYRDQLAKGFADTQGNPLPNPIQNALEYVHPKFKASGDLAAGVQDAISRLQDQAEFYRKQYGAGPNLYDSAVERLKAADPNDLRPAGHMYQVGINSNPENFLDWDKTYGEQSPTVQDAVSNAMFTHDVSGPRGKSADDWLQQDQPTGEDIYNRLHTGTIKGAEPRLQGAGIPGIKYLDQGSRATGEGTSNYVVFDPDTIEILKKYGLAGALGTTGAGAATFSVLGQPQQGTTINSTTPSQGQGFY